MNVRVPSESREEEHDEGKRRRECAILGFESGSKGVGGGVAYGY